jgi:hypothetical protein
MTRVREAITSLQRKGATRALCRLVGMVVDRAFDLRNGTDTCAVLPLKELTIVSDNKERGARYEPSRVPALRKLFRLLRRTESIDGVLLDYGCGKGRVLLVAAQIDFREVRGVEFARELCDTARHNWAVYQARAGSMTRCQIIEADATDYAVREDETLFFFWHPFDEKVLAKVATRIVTSLNEHPRKVLLVFYLWGHTYRSTMEQFAQFKRLRAFYAWGYNVAIYANVEQPLSVSSSR